MKASLYFKYGGPEVLTIKEIEKPTPKKNELLVSVKAATVNRTDCAMLRAKPAIMRLFTGLTKPKNPILGTDFAGEVVAVGDAVTKFNVGDRVFGFNDAGVCSHAQFLTISEESPLGIIPENISFEKAAASIEGAHYAINFFNKVEIKKGQKILVNGATGAIGNAGLQILKYLNTEVTAVGNTKNLELLKNLGADRVIDYLKEDFTKEREVYDFIFDAVGKSTFGKCKPQLKDKGIYISSELGPNAENLFYSISTPIFGGKKVVFPFPHKTQESIDFVHKLLKEGHFKPVIDRIYPLEKIADAFSYVETGEKTGNVVISMIPN